MCDEHALTNSRFITRLLPKKQEILIEWNLQKLTIGQTT